MQTPVRCRLTHKRRPEHSCTIGYFRSLADPCQSTHWPVRRGTPGRQVTGERRRLLPRDPHNPDSNHRSMQALCAGRQGMHRPALCRPLSLGPPCFYRWKSGSIPSRGLSNAAIWRGRSTSSALNGFSECRRPVETGRDMLLIVPQRAQPANTAGRNNGYWRTQRH